jgi:membrane associated rhomboid family serine protease
MALTLGLVAICAGWTVYARSRHMGYAEAGALTGLRLWEGEFWRLFSAMFLHHMGGWFHLAANGISLLFVGRAIEGACGRGILLGWLFGPAMAGFAASLVFRPDSGAVLMGISGGIAGLVGLVLAIEWASSRSVLQFLRQRNTLLILLFIALGVALASQVETKDLRVDHVGHAGGFLCGLLAGLAHYTRRGIRRARGIAVLAALSVLPVAYAARPLLDPGYQLWRAGRAYRAGEYEAAVRAYERARELEPGALDRPRARAELLESYLRLAADAPDPATLVEKARALGGREAGPWVRFAAAAEQRCPLEAYVAWREAAAILPSSVAWEPYVRALRLLRARETPAPVETLACARGATAGLKASPVLEAEIAAAADAVAALAPGPADADSLSDLYRILAENTSEKAWKPKYRLRSAEWLFRARREGASGAPDDEVKARFRAALSEAAFHGDAETRGAAERWFREAGIPVPEPDLEGEEGGG